MDKNTLRYHIRRIEDNKNWIRQIVRETYDYFNPCDYKKLDYSYQVSWSAAKAFTQNIFWDKFNEKKSLKMCKNSVETKYEKAIFTMLTEGHDYVISAIKLIKSIKNNVNKSLVDTILIEIVEKPLKFQESQTGIPL